MRFFWCILILAVVAVLIGLTPRPLFKPDWRSSYQAAINENDCEGIDRVIELLFIVGLDVEGHAEAFKNYEAKRCKYADLTQKEVEIAEALGLVGLEWDGRTFLNSDIWSSEFGQRLRILNREKFPSGSFVRNRERDLFQTFLESCYNKLPSGFGGNPNYELLEFGLKNPNISLDQIAEIARNQRASCAYSIVTRANTIASASTTPEEFAAIPRLLWMASVLAKEIPELGSEIESLEAKIPQKAYELAGVLNEQQMELSAFSCDKWYGDRVLEAAIQCAVSAESAIGVQNNAAMSAIYYARRAERLGWRDVGKIAEEASHKVSDECYNAIIEHEAKEVEGISDSRDFRQLAWSKYSGDACGRQQTDQLPETE